MHWKSNYSSKGGVPNWEEIYSILFPIPPLCFICPYQLPPNSCYIPLSAPFIVRELVPRDWGASFRPKRPLHSEISRIPDFSTPDQSLLASIWRILLSYFVCGDLFLQKFEEGCFRTHVELRRGVVSDLQSENIDTKFQFCLLPVLWTWAIYLLYSWILAQTPKNDTSSSASSS